MEILESFGVDIRLLITSAINFIVLLFLLNKIAYQPLLKVLDQRKKTIDESLKNAELIEQKLRETEEKEREILRKARFDAQNLLTKAEEQAKIRQQELIEQAEQHAHRLMEQSEKRLEQQGKEMQHQIQIHLADLVMAATKAVLGKKMPDSMDAQYIEGVIKHLPERK